MDTRVSAIVICQSSLMREAIAASLTPRNIAVVQSVAVPESADPSLHAEVGIVIERGNLTRATCDSLLRLSVDSWVVVCDEPHDLLHAHLSMHHPLVSGVPSALGGSDLAHVMHLAAAGHRLCLDDQCSACSDREAKRVFTAGLESDQWQLMQFLAGGYSNKEIARIESVTEGTIKARVRCLLGRLRVANRTQAAVMAARAGLGRVSLCAHGVDKQRTHDRVPSPVVPAPRPVGREAPTLSTVAVLAPA